MPASASPSTGVTCAAEYQPDHQRMVAVLLVLLERHAQAAPAPTPPREVPHASR
jgi:hypothetical protein